jgi:hypothetical protein
MWECQCSRKLRKTINVVIVMLRNRLAIPWWIWILYLMDRLRLEDLIRLMDKPRIVMLVRNLSITLLILCLLLLGLDLVIMKSQLLCCRGLKLQGILRHDYYFISYLTNIFNIYNMGFYFFYLFIFIIFFIFLSIYI